MKIRKKTRKIQLIQNLNKKRQKINKIRMNLKINLSHLKLRMKEILKIF